MIVPSIKQDPACEVTKIEFYAMSDTILRLNLMIFKLQIWHHVYNYYKNIFLK
jgi:hypothetical protein